MTNLSEYLEVTNRPLESGLVEVKDPWLLGDRDVVDSWLVAT